ncbi:hypothetical protein UlMin_034001 [Ulmus minor]
MSFVNGVQQYPAPLAFHEDLLRDARLFWEKLRQFHFKMNSKFMTPVVGGDDLDLHKLYEEVTRRGGFEKVVEEKKWREVGAKFMFSPTTTSASFVLRKHYLNLLFHFEQVHFFNMQGPLIDPPVATPSNHLGKKKLAVVPYSPGPNIEVTGTIHAKCDVGYWVTVKMGSETLEGMIYLVKDDEPSIRVPMPCTAIVPYTGKPLGRGRRKRRNKRRGDPNHPKPNRSGYNFFFAEQHNKLKSQFPNQERVVTKMIGESWSNLSAEERLVYQNIGMEDKERYKKELKEYREKLKQKQSMELVPAGT